MLQVVNFNKNVLLQRGRVTWTFKEEYSCQYKYFKVIDKGASPETLKSYTKLSWYPDFFHFDTFVGL